MPEKKVNLLCVSVGVCAGVDAREVQVTYQSGNVVEANRCSGARM